MEKRETTLAQVSTFNDLILAIVCVVIIPVITNAFHCKEGDFSHPREFIC